MPEDTQRKEADEIPEQQRLQIVDAALIENFPGVLRIRCCDPERDDRDEHDGIYETLPRKHASVVNPRRVGPLIFGIDFRLLLLLEALVVVNGW